MASAQATSIRMNAEAEGRRILRTALSATLLAPKSQAGGRVCYDREKNAREILLRIPLT
jgi:hypothetical protein